MAVLAMDDKKRRMLTAQLNTIVVMVRSDSPDLTDRQKTVLLKTYLDDAPQTVRGLAEYCNISKPAITRALDRLAEFDLIRRKTDPTDRRSIHVQRTPAGQTFMRKFGDILQRANQENV